MGYILCESDMWLVGQVTLLNVWYPCVLGDYYVCGGAVRGVGKAPGLKLGEELGRGLRLL